jgi:Tfp pilus assembly protein PilF
LERAVLLENGQLSRYAFKNIAGIAIRLGEFDWTASFLEKFSPTVEASHRRNYTDYNLAKLHHARRDYAKAMRLLHKVEYEDVFLNLDAKVLLLKIYFEQGETEALESFIQSFQRFLQRKSKELGYHRENYLNTLHFANKLLTINGLDKVEKERLRSEIIGAKALGEREWLLERL